MQRRELVELVENHVGIRTGFECDHQTHGFFEITLVLNSRNVFDLVTIHQGGNLFDNIVPFFHVRDFFDDNAVTFFDFFDFGACPHHDRAATGMVSLANATASTNDSACGEVRPLDDRHDLVDRDLGLVDHSDQSVAHLAKIVGRDGGGHANRDPAGTIDQEIGKPRGQDGWFRVPLVVGWHEVDGVLLEIVQHLGRDTRQARFGVPHGRRRQASDRTKVALLVHQQVPHIPLLRHADERVVNRLVTVRVIITHALAGDFRAFGATGTGPQVEIVHGHQNAPL